MVWVLGYGENVDLMYMFTGDLCTVSYEVKLENVRISVRSITPSVPLETDTDKDLTSMATYHPLLLICWKTILLNIPCKSPVDFNSLPDTAGQKTPGEQ